MLLFAIHVPSPTYMVFELYVLAPAADVVSDIFASALSTMVQFPM